MLAVAGRHGGRGCGVAVVAAHGGGKDARQVCARRILIKFNPARLVPILRRSGTSWLRARPNRPAYRFPRDDILSASSSYIVAAVRPKFTPAFGRLSVD